MNLKRYMRLIERLIYLVMMQPDLAYAISILNRFVSVPKENHMLAVEWDHPVLKRDNGARYFTLVRWQ